MYGQGWWVRLSTVSLCLSVLFIYSLYLPQEKNNRLFAVVCYGDRAKNFCHIWSKTVAKAKAPSYTTVFILPKLSQQFQELMHEDRIYRSSRWEGAQNIIPSTVRLDYCRFTPTRISIFTKSRPLEFKIQYDFTATLSLLFWGVNWSCFPCPNVNVSYRYPGVKYLVWSYSCFVSTFW